jgi:hypothetical protein
VIERDDVSVEVWWSDDRSESRDHNSQIENYKAALAERERHLAELPAEEAQPHGWFSVS